MKKMILILISLALSLLVLNAQDNGGDKVVVKLTNPGQPVFLKASLLNGSIRISGYDGKEVIVESLARGKMLKDDDDTEEDEEDGIGPIIVPAEAGEIIHLGKHEKERKDRQGMKRIGGGIGAGLTVTEKNNKVEVEIESLWASIDLDIKVPYNTSLKLNAVNGGQIVVDGVNGSHEIEHVNGKINMNNISGSVLANTTNGDIKVAFKQVDPAAEMSFASFNGDVDVSFPAALKATVKFSTERGEIYSDFDVSSRQVTDQKVQDRRSTGGRYEVRFDKAIHGSINGGGQKLDFKTYNGDILIRKNK